MPARALHAGGPRTPEDLREWRQSEQHARSDNEYQARCERTAAEPHVAKPRQFRRRQTNEEARDRQRERQARDPADRSEEDRLGQELSSKTRRCDTERRPYRDFMRALCRPE